MRRRRARSRIDWRIGIQPTCPLARSYSEGACFRSWRMAWTASSPRQGDFLLRLFIDDLDPGQVPIPNAHPGRYLALHLRRPIGRTRFMLGRFGRTFGQGPGTPLYPPQQVERSDDAIRRASAGPREFLKGPSVRMGNTLLFNHFLEYLSRVPQTFKDTSFQDGSLNQLFKPMLQRPESTEQVSAVHGGYVARLQRLQGLNVVPIQEMTLVALQFGDRLHGTPQCLHDLVSRHISEIPGGQRAQHPKTDIRRTGAHCQLVLMKDLVVVGWKPGGLRRKQSPRNSARFFAQPFSGTSDPSQEAGNAVALSAAEGSRAIRPEGKGTTIRARGRPMTKFAGVQRYTAQPTIPLSRLIRPMERRNAGR